MNCDQAFDAMTDPEFVDRSVLLRHLDSCARCRQMYQTLEPALGLFAALDEPNPSLAEDSAKPPGAGLRLAQQIAGRLSQPGAALQHPVRRRLWGAVFAALVAGLLLTVGLRSMAPMPAVAPPATRSKCAWLERGSSSDSEPARTVVLACVTCHLGQARVDPANDGEPMLLCASIVKPLGQTQGLIP